MSIPLGHHARRLAAHQGHGEHADPIQMMVGLVLLWVFLRVVQGVSVGIDCTRA